MNNKIVQIILSVVIIAVIAIFYTYSRNYVAGLYEVEWYKYYESSQYSVRLLAPIPFIIGIFYYIYWRIKKKCKKQES